MRLTSLAQAFVALPCLWSAACSGPPDQATPERATPDAKAQPAIVQRDVEHLVKSMYAGKYDVVIAYSHAAILAANGGSAKARAALEAAVAPVLAKGCRIESFRFPSPPEILLTERALYAIVPTLTVLQVGDERTESTSFQFGVLEPGSTLWKYIDGSRITGESANALFADFPADHVFPRASKKRL